MRSVLIFLVYCEKFQNKTYFLMKKITILILLLQVTIHSFSQNIEKQKIEVVKEGKMLYKSEMASWYGTDLFMEKYKDKENIGGYFSYTEGSVSKCIFYSKAEKPKVIGTISFNQDYDIKTAKTELDERSFSKNELDLYDIRTKAFKAITTDTIFHHFKNANLNLIPIINNKEKKVYVLTGPTNNGVVLFGNDYLLTFSNDNQLKSTKKLHANLIPVYFGDDKEKVAIASMHSHLPETGDLITATDICTTMLYQKFTGWENVYVMSQKYVSIWDCKKDELVVMTKEAFEKMK